MELYYQSCILCSTTLIVVELAIVTFYVALQSSCILNCFFFFFLHRLVDRLEHWLKSGTDSQEAVSRTVPELAEQTKKEVEEEEYEGSAVDEIPTSTPAAPPPAPPDFPLLPISKGLRLSLQRILINTRKLLGALHEGVSMTT